MLKIPVVALLFIAVMIVLMTVILVMGYEKSVIEQHLLSGRSDSISHAVTYLAGEGEMPMQLRTPTLCPAWPDAPVWPDAGRRAFAWFRHRGGQTRRRLERHYTEWTLIQEDLMYNGGFERMRWAIAYLEREANLDIARRTRPESLEQWKTVAQATATWFGRLDQPTRSRLAECYLHFVFGYGPLPNFSWSFNTDGRVADDMRAAQGE